MGGLAEFFPLGMNHYLIGGIVIGCGVGLLYLTTGLVGGISSFYTTTWSYLSRAPYFQMPSHISSRAWRLVYSLGLVTGAALWVVWSDGAITLTQVSPWQLTLGGFIAGFGARLGNGCTSGHGICGIASLSWLSLVAVVVFLLTAIVTANVVSIAAGGAL